MKDLLKELETLSNSKTISPDMLYALFSKMSRIEGEIQKLGSLLIELSNGKANRRKYISEQEAMSLLGIKSKTTLWRLRTEGKIIYTSPSRKILLYDRESIEVYLDENRQECF